MSELLKNLVWGAPQLWPWVVVVTLIAIPTLVWAYFQAAVATRWRVVSVTLKLAAIVALALCILEPLKSVVRPVPGANLFLVVVDNSQSLEVKGRGNRLSRAGQFKQVLTGQQDWQVRLSQQFDVRNYCFDSRLRSVAAFETLKWDGDRSTLVNTLKTIADRFGKRPVAGVLLFSDGNATDGSLEGIDWKGMPPIYPVALSDGGPAKDISVQLTSVKESNFEGTPVTLRAEVVTHGYAGRQLVGELLDEFGKKIESVEATGLTDGKALEFRFKLKPEKPGLQFYRLRVSDKQELVQFKDASKSKEATLENNERLVVVDRGGGPYRILYVSGRPNWEFKFLRRAIEFDDQVNLIGLIRIAKREAKFDFRGRQGESKNSLFRGFGNNKDEEAEKYDQPVMLRVGLEEGNLEELRDGFPKAPKELYKYHAIIIDDLESGLFTQDQLTLMRNFVFRRGGGFLMLGGQESFVKGKYSKTPLEELLPVYLDNLPPTSSKGQYRLALTREGILKPWVRVRSTEEDEEDRLKAMPAFRTINRVQSHKPGATVLAYVTDTAGKSYPALVESANTGRGRSAALLLGDFWRWGLHRPKDAEYELGKAWRQTVRWLIADVPHRIEVDATRADDQPGQPTRLSVTVRDEEYEPLDNAKVKIVVSRPDQTDVKLTATASDSRPGVYETTFVPRESGAYRAAAHVTAADGSDVGVREAGWVAEPAADEFRSLSVNTQHLMEIAEKTDGEVIKLSQVDNFVENLDSRKIPYVKRFIAPVWDRVWMFLFAVSCLCLEWGIRRWKALP